ncbi:ATP-binding cassette domain-containing protein [Chryseolinea lacunae]|uniref:ABC transporter ATP-binding protein n=1 Tax=Chryseolinea lacunae TaxID=2801331 RepID=A0ABS1KRT8_9BACT|nr:ATP-binding cassette domain-containing protein [Chryseolinea lacunae]MBL0741977.1 ABC transporter ATP-binding protein [Chryseolinea lacunae]
MNYTKNEVLIDVKEVNLTYDKVILRDINFRIQNIVRPGMNQGQVVSLIGRSGIGKTQLFKILAGLVKPNSGTVMVGVDQHPVEAGEVGIVSQNYILFNHRSVHDNLRLAMKHDSLALNDKDKDALIADYAQRFALEEHLKKYPLQLSGGQRQRVSIIQQVLTGNRFILLDEPFSGLDALMIDRVMELLTQVATLHELNTLVIVSHDVENSLAISDTAYILAKEKEKEGATITETLDLIEMGLAWNAGIREDSRFQQLVSQMKHKI